MCLMYFGYSYYIYIVIKSTSAIYFQKESVSDHIDVYLIDNFCFFTGRPQQVFARIMNPANAARITQVNNSQSSSNLSGNNPGNTD